MSAGYLFLQAGGHLLSTVQPSALIAKWKPGGTVSSVSINMHLNQSMITKHWVSMRHSANKDAACLFGGKP